LSTLNPLRSESHQTPTYDDFFASLSARSTYTPRPFSSPFPSYSTPGAGPSSQLR
jgi:hypothetical protein